MASLTDECCSEAGKQAVGDRRLRPFFLDNPVIRFFFPSRRYLEGHVEPGMTVADLGCGPGYLTLPAARAVGENGKVYAVDSDERHIAAVRGRAASNDISNVEVRQASAADIGHIPDSAVDLVFAKGLLCCMLDHEGAVREIQRILKPGGSVFFSVTKFVGRSDRRRVNKQEWEGILSRFAVRGRGEGIGHRWAWARKRQGL